MAQIPFRANLQTESFPLLSELSGRTVIVGQQDQNYVRGVSAQGGNGVPLEIGIPQVYYAHNVMPSIQGLQSVGYDTPYSGLNWGAVPPSLVDFKTAYLIQGAQIVSSRPAATGYKTYISAPKAGANSVFTLDVQNTNWRLANGAPALAADTVITVATVNGVTYIYFSKIGCYVYNNLTNTLIQRTLTGLNTAATIGIVASNGYLFTYTETAVAWSSVTDVEDFTPSDVSGAGGGQLQEAKGKIVTASVTALGMIIYTEANAVSVIYSGNADFPWNFKSIPSSGGIANPELVSAEQTGGFQQVYSTNGLQQVGHTGARTISPQITDFISGRLFEDFDSTTLQFTQIEFNWSMIKGLAVVADRYIVISYGLGPTGFLTHAIVLDVALGRMGKLKITHNFCLELRDLNTDFAETPRDSIAFLQSNGDIKTVDFNFNTPAPDSVLLLGKYQYIRQRMLELHEVELENVKAGADFYLQAMPTLDGKNYIAPETGYELENSPNFRRLAFSAAVGTNISLLAKGRFNLTSLELWFSVHGKR